MKPRTDAELAAFYRENNPEECAMNAYANDMIQRERVLGYPKPGLLAREYSTDGRIIGSEYPKDKDDKE